MIRGGAPTSVNIKTIDFESKVRWVIEPSRSIEIIKIDSVLLQNDVKI